MPGDPLAALVRFFTPEVLARSREVLGRGRIRIRHRDLEAITAEIQGTRKRPYRTEVVVLRDARGSLIDVRGTCACPVGHRCKHVAALAVLLLEGLQPEASADERAREEVLRWAERMVVRASAANEEPRGARAKRELLFILDRDGDGVAPPVVHVVAVSLTSTGYGRERALDLDADARSIKGWVNVDDRLLFHELRLRERQGYGYGHISPRLPPDETGPDLLAALVATGRLHLGSSRAPAMHWDRPRRAEVGWLFDHRGTQRPTLLGLPHGAQILAMRPPHWVDPKTGRCGAIVTDLSPAAAQALLHAPSLPAEAAQGLTIDQWPERSGIVAPRRMSVHQLREVAPTPLLELGGDDSGGWARLSFRYGEAIADPDEPAPEASTVSDATRVLRVSRDLSSEAALCERLACTGLRAQEVLQADAHGRWPSRWTFAHLESSDDEEDAWLSFAAQELPALSAEGWEVERDHGFRWSIATVDAWYADVDDTQEGDWFALSIGVEVDGVRVGVLPAITRALARGGFGPHIPDDGVLLDLGDGRRVRMPADRLRLILAVLLEVFGNRPLDRHGRLLLPRGAASRLIEVDPHGDLRWHGSARLRELGERIAAAADRQFAPVTPPAGLHAQLRGYQLVGLQWLQFLRRFAVGGVLADDMGLGKTVQTLAHLLLEREQGRLDRPCLVVAPTSVLPVWRDEAARFAPSLRTLVYHGSRRGQHHGALADHDLIVTSYAILLRDADVLARLDLHLAVLDESHAIKNSAAKVSVAARRLNARTRLCLTGTPLENNLFELWSQVDFVMPGLLGTPSRFATLFAKPIEDHADATRRQALAHRLAPFILRRTKKDVLPELPEKTELVRYAELGRAQRDLYEAVRLGVEADVRRLIDDQGLARNQLTVLEALLKLREVCCHPRLVPYPAARKVTASAKLELLLELLDEIVPAGGRVLVFSQFTRMLALIGDALDQRGIGWVKLTGRTRKRDEVVARFQAGDVPVFLISLKAGGTGMNLTAADTVIHFDPWWNPAAQDQATDRAHRIGQGRAVLVLSLVARGTVEERMLHLQRRKRALAADVLGDAVARGAAGRLRLGEPELAALLAPLSEQ